MAQPIRQCGLLPPKHPNKHIMKTPLQKLLELTWLKWLWTMKGEITIGVLAVSLFFNLVGWLRAIDPTSATLDPGVLMAVAVGVLAVVVGLILFWVIIRITAPLIDAWFDGDLPKQPGDTYVSFEMDWRHTTPAVRLSIFAALLIGTLLSIALVTIAVA